MNADKGIEGKGRSSSALSLRRQRWLRRDFRRMLCCCYCGLASDVFAAFQDPRQTLGDPRMNLSADLASGRPSAFPRLRPREACAPSALALRLNIYPGARVRGMAKAATENDV